MFSNDLKIKLENLGAVISENDEILNFNAIEEEYMAVRHGLGIFLLNETCVYSVRGKNATDFLNYIASGNIDFLEYNHIIYTTILNKDGLIVDFVHIFRTLEGFLVTSNLSRQHQLLEIFKNNKFDDVEITDITDKYAVISIEGVYSWELAKELAGSDIVGLRYNGFLNSSYEKISELICARCGISGEYGFRFLFPVEYTVFFLEAINDYKTERIKKFCGKRVLQTICQEIRFPFMGIGIYEDSSPLETGVGWMIDWRKDDYLGKNMIEKKKLENHQKMIGYICDAESIQINDTVTIENEVIGSIMSNCFSYSLRKSIGFVMLDEKWSSVNIADYTIGKGSNPIVTKSTPFFITESVKVQMY